MFCCCGGTQATLNFFCVCSVTKPSFYQPNFCFCCPGRGGVFINFFGGKGKKNLFPTKCSFLFWGSLFVFERQAVKFCLLSTLILSKKKKKKLMKGGIQREKEEWGLWNALSSLLPLFEFAVCSWTVFEVTSNNYQSYMFYTPPPFPHWSAPIYHRARWACRLRLYHSILLPSFPPFCAPISCTTPFPPSHLLVE